MKDLMKEFFKRDLTDAEEEELGRQLKASPKNSMRFAKQAKIFYTRTGLPRVGRPGTRISGLGSGTMTLKIAGTLIAGSAMVVATIHLINQPAVNPIPTPVPSVISAPTLQATRAVTSRHPRQLLSFPRPLF